MTEMEGSGQIGAECSFCKGTGRVNTLWRGIQLLPRGETACRACSGSGRLSEAALQRLEQGRTLCRARIASGKSLHEAAAERGITPQDLADMEWGRR